MLVNKKIYIEDSEIENKIGLMIETLNPSKIKHNDEDHCWIFEYKDDTSFTDATEKLRSNEIEFYAENPKQSAKLFKRLSKDKKSNVQYWDMLEADSMIYIEKLISQSFDKNGKSHHFDEDEKMFFAKNVLEKTTEELKKLSNGKITFPYVDENY